MRVANEAHSTVTGTFSRVRHSLISKFILAIAACFLASGIAQAQVSNVVGNYAGDADGGWSGGANPPVTGPSDGACANIGNVGSQNATSAYSFSIPMDATITAINFFVDATAGNTDEQMRTQLASNASSSPYTFIGSSNDVTIAGNGSNCASTIVHGFNFTLADWGTNSGTVTPSVVNDANFGIVFTTLQSSSIKVDSNCLEVEYTTDSGPASQIGCFTVPFTVNKDFSDDNPAQVEITLSCTNEDSITANPLMASEGNPAVFAVRDENGDATCTASETGGLPAGYSKDESDCQTPQAADGGECTIVNTAQNPSMMVSKTVTNTGSGAGGAFAAGDTIMYTIEVTNDGNVTLNNVVVSDALLGLTNESCSASLAPAASCQVMGSYMVTQADIDNNGGGDGDIDNTATADSDETDPQDAMASANLVAQNPSKSMTKTVTNTGSGAGGLFAAGDTIMYTIEVTNDGNVTLTNVVVSDALLGLTNESCSASLAPAASCQVMGTYMVTQGDIDNNGGGDGDIDNTATADSDQAQQAMASAEADLVPQDPSLAVNKMITNTGSGDGGAFAAGDTIMYTIEVTNDGNVTLTNVVVSDALLGLTNESCSASLAPGAMCSVMGSYMVTQGDIDDNGGGDGDIDNTAEANSDQAGPQQGMAEAELVDQTASIAVTKTITNTGSGAGGDFQPGDTVMYTIEVTNDGNVELNNVLVSDALLGLTDESCAATLAPDASCEVMGTYMVTQDDLDNNGGGDGDIDNTATADSDEAGPQQAMAAAPLVPQDPDITLVKTADPTEYSAVGDVINYTFDVTNSGNITLHDVIVSDPLIEDPPNSGTISCPGGNPIPTMAPGAMVSCSASYTITQADLDAGSVSNTATAEGCSEPRVQIEGSVEGDCQGVTARDDAGAVIEREFLDATFRVTKDFSDDNPANVTVFIDCNTGLPLHQQAEVGEFANPFDFIEFIVQDFEPGTMDCDIFEAIPAGYEPDYTASLGEDGSAGAIFSDAEGCHFEDVDGGRFSCEIFNDLQPVDVVVEKEWIDENPDFLLPLVVNVTLECSDPIMGGSPCIGVSSEIGSYCSQQFIDPANPGQWQVLPHFEGTTCSATEEPVAATVTDETDCEEMILFPGQGDRCVIVNTRLFEGIPTLNQYGLLLMALLMLGIGAVAYRRFV